MFWGKGLESPLGLIREGDVWTVLYTQGAFESSPPPIFILVEITEYYPLREVEIRERFIRVSVVPLCAACLYGANQLFSRVTTRTLKSWGVGS